jgi:NAD-dependent dihydropyrimidine dehydrogenase PreA subunit
LLKMHSGFKKIIRLFSLVIAIALQLPFLHFSINAALPLLSPFVAILTITACHKPDPDFLLAIPLLALAIFKGRWFCRYLCPYGTTLYYIQKLSPFSKQAFLKLPGFNKWLILAGIVAAILCVPFFAAFDPLVIFNSFFAGLFLYTEKNSAAYLLYTLPFIAIIVFCIAIPNIWCEKICPLGCLQHFAALPRKKLIEQKTISAQPADKKKSFLFSRRAFLFSMFACIPAIAATIWLKRKIPPQAIRPPGALEEEKFAIFCIHCGACAEVCPQKIIAPDIRSGALFYGTPHLVYNSAYCNEVCNKCTLLCPTNAIKPLSIEQKQHLKIGEAKIDQKKCIAWSCGESCMVCHEFCPYQAIEAEKHQGVNCPIIIPEKCIGCGACESQCPARPHKAITVHPATQKFLPPKNSPA